MCEGSFRTKQAGRGGQNQEHRSGATALKTLWTSASCTPSRLSPRWSIPFIKKRGKRSWMVYNKDPFWNAHFLWESWYITSVPDAIADLSTEGGRPESFFMGGQGGGEEARFWTKGKGCLFLWGSSCIYHVQLDVFCCSFVEKTYRIQNQQILAKPARRKKRQFLLMFSEHLLLVLLQTVPLYFQDS